ncbi:protein lsd1 [Nicotiana attenuata]|uniref:Protein lsd1 n=1 Tax=Nicotiana attenuata TaxID=49451 RepID=A0A1J6KBT0_NICAT|nr:protein lsd1 [Nicotiana attenuata]
MPVPLAPYPTPPTPFTPPANGTQSQLVCSGCRNLLLYPVGATSVCCAVCNAVTAVPPPGTEMAQLVCGGRHTLLMYIRGATSVQCSCCHTVNLAMEGSTCELWQLPHAVDVPIWGTISEMCSVQFCDSCRGKYKILFSIKSLSFYAAANDELVF